VRRQGQRTLRVRCEGLRRHHQAPRSRWPARAARRCAPRQPLRWRHPSGIIEDTETLTGRAIERAYVDKSYRGDDAQNPRCAFGQKRGVFGATMRELRRRSAIEPVIGHFESRRPPRPLLFKGHAGDAADIILAAVGYHFRRSLAWLRALLRLFLIALIIAHSDQLALMGPHHLKPVSFPDSLARPDSRFRPAAVRTGSFVFKWR
jgi:hypothetical protein